QAPAPRTAVNISSSTGLYTRPATVVAASASPMETAKKGRPWAKLVVPSSGSTYQQRPAPSVRVPSSATMACWGKAARKRAVMCRSLARSAAVTRSASPLYSIPTRPRWSSRIAPASRAMTWAAARVAWRSSAGMRARGGRGGGGGGLQLLQGAVQLALAGGEGEHIEHQHSPGNGVGGDQTTHRASP